MILTHAHGYQILKLKSHSFGIPVISGEEFEYFIFNLSDSMNAFSQKSHMIGEIEGFHFISNSMISKLTYKNLTSTVKHKDNRDKRDGP